MHRQTFEGRLWYTQKDPVQGVSGGSLLNSSLLVHKASLLLAKQHFNGSDEVMKGFLLCSKAAQSISLKNFCIEIPRIMFGQISGPIMGQPS